MLILYTFAGDISFEEIFVILCLQKKQRGKVNLGANGCYF